MTTLPPLLAGGLKATLTLALAAVTNAMVGALGTDTGNTLLDGADGMPLTEALAAVTVQVTAMPAANPSTTMGEVGPAALPAPQIAV